MERSHWPEFPAAAGKKKGGLDRAEAQIRSVSKPFPMVWDNLNVLEQWFPNILLMA